MFVLQTLDASCKDCLSSSVGMLSYDWPKPTLPTRVQAETDEVQWQCCLAMAEATADTLVSRTFFSHDYLYVKSETFCYCIQNHVSFLCRKKIRCYYCGHERFHTL